jgi:ABC-type phosphate transport system permease subunit
MSFFRALQMVRGAMVVSLARALSEALKVTLLILFACSHSAI